MDYGRPSFLPRYRIERRPDGKPPVALAFVDDLRTAQRILERCQRIGRRRPPHGDLVVIDQVTEAVVASLSTGRQTGAPTS
jgi:hypothetical protein